MNAKEAAQQTFDQRRRAYEVVFASELGRTVLEDLASFCRANETCIVPGDRDAMFILEGRREVWLRIQQHINLSVEELWALYTGERRTPLMRRVDEVTKNVPG